MTLLKWTSLFLAGVVFAGCGRSEGWAVAIEDPSGNGEGADSAGDPDSGGDGDGDGDDGDADDGDGDDGDADDGDSDDGDADDGDDEDPKQADILFVVDNSGSMGLEQANLTVKMPRLLEVLEREQFDYRIGFTTTDTGNPLCLNTDPEDGHLQALSCLDHLDDFLFPGGNGSIDLRPMCTDRCTQPGLTTTDGKPWIDVGDHGTNLPPGVEVAEAVRCFGLQGINGCGLESPLEAVARTHARALQPGEDEFGFFRQGATAAIVFLTDEADCSYNPEFESIFLPSGDRTFWSNPSAGSANSAVCWNAGVICEGGPGVYDHCRSENKDVLGMLGVGDESAVLRPVEHYVSDLQLLQEIPEHLVIAGFLGVPVGYADGSADLIYADAEDPAFQDAFGIGPGCVGPLTTAVPPVRLLEIIQRFEGPDASNIHSVCSDDYGPALEALGETIVSHST